MSSQAPVKQAIESGGRKGVPRAGRGIQSLLFRPSASCTPCDEMNGYIPVHGIPNPIVLLGWRSSIEIQKSKWLVA